MEPARFDEMRRGCYDIEARVADMDLDGVYATLCFPSLIAGFAGTIFAKQQGPGARPRVPAGVERLAHRGVGRPAPRPHHPAAARVAAAIPRSRPPTSARNAERGFKAVSFPENPVDLKLPSMHTDHWDPFLRACEETRNRHLPAQRFVVVDRGPLAGRAARAVHVAVLGERDGRPRPTGCGRASRPASPSIQIAFSEGGIGWVPMLIDRIDYVLDHSAVGSHGWDDPNLSPTDALRRNFWFCTIDIPLDDARCATTSASTTSASRATTRTPTPRGPTRSCARPTASRDFTPTEVRKVTWENASKLFRHPVPPELQATGDLTCSI